MGVYNFRPTGFFDLEGGALVSRLQIRFLPQSYCATLRGLCNKLTPPPARLFSYLKSQHIARSTSSNLALSRL
jgi:hypothetical protein